MKQLPLYLSILLVIAVIVGVFTLAHGYTSAHQKGWEIESLSTATVNAQLAQVEALEQAKRAAWFTQFYQVLFPSLLIMGIAVVGVYLFIKSQQQAESMARQVDGSYALQTYRNKQGQTWTVDPNKQSFGAIGFDRQTGQLITDAQMVGADRQLTYNLAIQKTRTTQARQITDIRNSAQAKLEAGYYDREQGHYIAPEVRVVEPETPLLTATPYNPLQLTDAFKQSTPDRWLLGNGTDGPMSFNVKQTVHTGLVGATGTGKTSSVALLMALLARKAGMQVIALDGAGGVDWMTHNKLFEVYESDYTTIGDQVHDINAIHNTRMKEILKQGVPNIEGLDYQLPSLFVIMEEHGRTMQGYKAANSKGYAQTESALSNLMRVSRKTGIYFLLIDQSLNGWSGEVKANVKDYIAFHLGGGQGAAFNAYELHKLRANGQFWNNGQTYDAWHTASQVDSVARLVQPQKLKLLSTTPIAPSPKYVTVDTQKLDTTHDRGGRFEVLDTQPTDDTDVIHRDTLSSKPDTTGDTASDTAPVSSVAQLTGRPVSKRDISLVQNTYAMTGSASETARLLWGSKNNSRVKWVMECTKGQGVGHD